MSDRDLISVQVHRLVHGPGVPEPLTRPYGVSASSSSTNPIRTGPATTMPVTRTSTQPGTSGTSTRRGTSGR